jgi:hypothetical protein
MRRLAAKCHSTPSEVIGETSVLSEHSSSWHRVLPLWLQAAWGGCERPRRDAGLTGADAIGRSLARATEFRLRGYHQVAAIGYRNAAGGWQSHSAPCEVG